MAEARGGKGDGGLQDGERRKVRKMGKTHEEWVKEFDDDIILVDALNAAKEKIADMHNRMDAKKETKEMTLEEKRVKEVMNLPEVVEARGSWGCVTAKISEIEKARMRIRGSWPLSQPQPPELLSLYDSYYELGHHYDNLIKEKALERGLDFRLFITKFVFA